MVYFVGAGPGAIDLITVRGKKLLEEADVIIYAGSLVNPEMLGYAKEGCKIYDSAAMNLDETANVMINASKLGNLVVRLHTGDQSIYGAVREQIDRLRVANVEFKSVPGVSSFCAAAAALDVEYTLPNVSQTLILTRMEGRTSVPEKEDLSLLASHNSSMVIFLSVGEGEKVRDKLINGGYAEDTPIAVVYKASWNDEKKAVGVLKDLPKMVKKLDITKTALILVGNFLGSDYAPSKLYDPSFSHEFRKATKE